MTSSEHKSPSSMLSNFSFGNALVGAIAFLLGIMSSYTDIILFIQKDALKGILFIATPIVVALLIALAVGWCRLRHKVNKLEADVRVLKSMFPLSLRDTFDRISEKAERIFKKNYELYEERLSKQFQKAVNDFIGSKKSHNKSFWERVWILLKDLKNRKLFE